MDHFKETFKYFKQKHDPVILQDVIDFELENASECVVPLEDFFKNDKNYSCASCVQFGLLPHQQWHIYTVKDSTGFYFIKNPFTTKGQQYWIKRCLQLYPRKPSITNLDLHYTFVDDIWCLERDPMKHKLLQKLSWATLGYHHNWDTKIYDPSNHSQFPKCLYELAKHIASCLKFLTFKPEATIINYYNSKSSLGIHNDHSEVELNEPILSISFGQTAIFLIGTNVRTEKPIATFLRSGDIVILSGQSRLSYHAVPTIIREPVSCNRYCSALDSDTWTAFCNYIETHRINISIRQVYPDNTAL